MAGKGEGLTQSEVKVLDLLREATIAFFNLPEHHPTDCAEWATQVHQLQHRVMARAAIRWKPDYFTPMEKGCVNGSSEG